MLGLKYFKLIDSISIHSVINGSKPAFKTTTDSAGYEALLEVAKANNLYADKSDFFVDIDKDNDDWIKSEQGQFFAYLARDKKVLSDLKKALEQKNDFLSGVFLGYPSCCTKIYAKKMFNMKGKKDWRLNMFSHSSQMCLVPHFPCSFNCKESIAIADKNIEILKKANYDFEGLKNYLKLPLYYQNHNTIIFNGIFKDNMIFYNSYKFSLRHNRLDRVFLNIDKGNRIFVRDDEVQILKYEKIIARYKKQGKNDGIIMKFD